ncbi:hypothetical protein [Nocardiopsis sp. NPDC057823]|uniref:hypothetical protein n=1 Tax=Nocardiopsis sp. NPDC057823 TaxID=3346256 RepID=UPI0036732DB5
MAFTRTVVNDLTADDIEPFRHLNGRLDSLVVGQVLISVSSFSDDATVERVEALIKLADLAMAAAAELKGQTPPTSVIAAAMEGDEVVLTDIDTRTSVRAATRAAALRALADALDNEDLVDDEGVGTEFEGYTRDAHKED